MGLCAGEVTDPNGVVKSVPIRVDGGAAKNDRIVQSIADSFGVEVLPSPYLSLFVGAKK